MDERELGSEKREHGSDERHHMADVFLVHRDVDHETQHGEEDVVGELKPEEDLQVPPDLDTRVARAHLRDHPNQHADRHAQGQNESESQELAQEGNPFRHRHCIEDLAHACFPLPPYQLAGPEDDEQRDDQIGGGNVGERQVVEDIVGSEEQWDAQVVWRLEHRESRHHGDDRQQDEPSPARRETRERRPRDGERLARARGKAECARSRRDEDRGGPEGRRFCGRGGVRIAPSRDATPPRGPGMMTEAKPDVSERERAESDADPQQPAREPGPVQPDQSRVHLGRCPYAPLFHGQAEQIQQLHHLRLQ